MKNKISAIIICGNEEQNIKDCLESVKWADEIIVIDSESKDATVEIAEIYTDKIFVKKWDGFSKQKEYALTCATNEWVLSIDADERVTDELANEILTKDLSGFEGYYIRRQNYFLGRLITTCGWEKDYQLRLFKKSKTRITDELVHEGFIVSGKRKNLENPLIHYSNKSLHQAIEKANTYSGLVAVGKFNKSKKYGLVRILIQPPVSFYHYFIARKGFKDGVHGFLLSLLHSINILMIVSKVWELSRKKTKNTSHIEN